MKIVLLIVIGIALSGCQAQSWQPYAALSYQPTPQPTSQPTATEAQPTPTAGAACVVIARKSLNLRSDASTADSVIIVLSAGEILTMTGNQRGAWIEVITSAGLQGWVNSTYCKGN